MVLATMGRQRVHDDRSAESNVGELERWLSVFGGAALAMYGVERRGASGALLALAGAELVRRGVSGRCMLYDAMGISTVGDTRLGSLPHPDAPTSRAAVLQARHAIKFEQTVTVNRPAAECYALWRDPENLPRFMSHVESVERTGDDHARWTLRLPGAGSVRMTAQVINDLPNELIAWKSTEDSTIATAGSVHFREAPGGRGTEVRLVMEAEPPGGGSMPKGIAKLLGKAPDAMLREDLQRFKQVAETGEPARA